MRLAIGQLDTFAAHDGFQPGDTVSWITGDRHVNFRKLLPLGLGDVEDVYGFESA